MDKIIVYLLKKKIITPSQARAIEIFMLWIVFSFVTQLIDLWTQMLNWQTITLEDFKIFLITFLTTTWTAILAWLKKYIRDYQKRLEEELKNLDIKTKKNE